MTTALSIFQRKKSDESFETFFELKTIGTPKFFKLYDCDNGIQYCIKQGCCCFLWLKMVALQLWKDYKLTWNETEFGNITFIRLAANSIWTPDILLYNRCAHRHQIYTYIVSQKSPPFNFFNNSVKN